MTEPHGADNRSQMSPAGLHPAITGAVHVPKDGAVAVRRKVLLQKSERVSTCGVARYSPRAPGQARLAALPVR